MVSNQPFAAPPPSPAPGGPAPLLFLISDTGGGHRSAARAVGEALDRRYPGRFAPVLCDPLGGPAVPWPLRLITGWYGPVIRRAPWLWGAAYHACDSRAGMWLLERTLLRLANGPVAAAASGCRPAAVVSFHPLTGRAAIVARNTAVPGAPVVTVVTDLARVHAAWRCPPADLLVSGWPPVASPFTSAPADRASIRRSLGLDGPRFLILLAGGAEGSGGLGRRARAILRRFPDAGVVAVCGHNRRLQRRLGRRAARSGGRLRVTGYTGDMATLLRCCDLVVTKAGPGTIAEAACCGTPMLLSSRLPGQEAGNIQLVTVAGAGRRVRGVRRLLAEIGTLRRDPGRLEAMRAAAAGLGRPGAAGDIAELIAGLATSDNSKKRLAADNSKKQAETDNSKKRVGSPC
jgi:1,2-diacylglycerol 3-beta-galactosyltransferase